MTVALAAALALAAVSVVATRTLGRAGRGEPTPVSVSESVDLHAPGPRVPRTFLGLSFELSSLPQIARYATGGDFVAMLRSLGPGVLRFGGVSADTRVAWTDAATRLPHWASVALGPGELRALGKLVEEAGWSVLLTIGLAHYDPAAAAREARAAKAALGARLAGIEIGNEPDAYARHGLRRAPWSFSSYRRQVEAYRRAISKVAPGIPLAGPDLSGSKGFASWGRGVAIEERPALLTGHHYPLGCHQLPPPSIARLLSPQTRRMEEMSLRGYTSVARARSIRFRVDETNTVSCGGVAGVSNTFASALWAVDYITRAMSAGAAGVNLQGNPDNCRGYTPLCAPTPEQLAAGAVGAQPEWYALLLASKLRGDRPLRITASPSRVNIDAAALLGAHGKLHVVIVDDEPSGARPAEVHLHVGPHFGEASVLALTAPSLASKTGVRLGGRGVAPDGSWHEPAWLEHRPNRGGVITLVVSSGSALLAAVAPAH